MWAWGANSYGQLGNKSTTAANAPVQVLGPDGQSGLSGITECGAGEGFSLALGAGGVVWAWGSDYNGQLGNTAVSSLSVLPVQVAGLSGVQAIAAGTRHALALKNGIVYGWGWNLYRQVGDGTSNDREVPVKIENFENIVAISAHEHHNLALMQGGTVWAWGSGYSGVPTRIEGLSDIVQVSAGDNHDLAVRKDGVVFSWGNNTSGQLGRVTSLSTDATPGPVWRFNVNTGLRSPVASDTPPAPLNFAAEPGSGNNINLTWSAVSDPLAVNDTWGYNLYYSPFPDVTKTTGTRITNVKSPYIHNGLQPGVTYYYVVTAVNGEFESPASVVASSLPGL